MGEWVELHLFWHAETELAIRVSDSGRDEDAVWVPLSTCKEIEKDLIGERPEVALEMKRWIAEYKEFI